MAKKHSIICTTRLPHELCLWKRNPTPAPTSEKVFGASSVSSHPKLFGLRRNSLGCGGIIRSRAWLCGFITIQHVCLWSV